MTAVRRDDLIEDVKYGRMTPGEAEAEAVRLGLGPLASKPDRLSFNPTGETCWTLPMAVAWIAWRSPDWVREVWDAYRRECWGWQPHSLPGEPGGPGHPVWRTPARRQTASLGNKRGGLGMCAGRLASLYHFFMVVIVIRYETTAAAPWALLFLVPTFFKDPIAIAVWTSFHVCLPSRPGGTPPSGSFRSS
jgi:hypothetical protein